MDQLTCIQCGKPLTGRRVFWLAYTEMNEDNEARASIEGVWTSLRALWAAVSRDRPACS